MLTFFGIERNRDETPADVFPCGLAPFIRKADELPTGRVIEDGAFGLLPWFAKELCFGRRTYNARSETVATLPSYRYAWQHGNRCVIPVEAIFEPCYETGRAVRWRIGQHGDVPLGIAGIYSRWRRSRTEQVMYSFAMLTVNAAGHPLFERMHRPAEEKRMVVILDPKEYDQWLCCTFEEAPSFFKQWKGELLAVPDPLIRPPRAISGQVGKPPETGNLF